MFWTNNVKAVCKLFMAVLIIASLILGVSMMSNGAALMGFLVIIVGILLSVCSVAGIMMVCEISENINEINHKMDKAVSALYSSKAPENASNSKINLTKIANSNDKNGDNVWYCPECGKDNPSSSRVCKDCGYNK